MSKSMYNYIEKTFQDRSSDQAKEARIKRLIKWRREENFSRIDRPTRLDRARKLGYRAKQGFVLVRGRVRRGTLRKTFPRKGRKPKRMGINKITMKKNLQRICEERSAKRYPNLEVLNSYEVATDGKHKFFEVILVDPHHPAIKKDPKINWICKKQHKNRVYRGLTSAGKKSRGLRKKGIGSEKARPSVKSKKGQIN